MSMLVDRFGRKHTYLRISVTDRCNLRCFYCMPHTGIDWRAKEEILTFEEIEKLASIFVTLGIEKVRLTGGEPLVRKDLPSLVAALARIPGLSTLAMTTNAVLLKREARRIRDAGLSQINISLDTLRPDRFERITGRCEHASVLAGVEAALSLGFQSLKLNVVVIDGVNDDEILDFVDFAHGREMNVRFIEFMPFKNNDWNIEKVVTYKEMLSLIKTRWELRPLAGEPGAVGRDYAIVGFPGKVSFVTSMSESFCASCNRLRLTADGFIKSCLFYPPERSLKAALRAGAGIDELKGIILEALSEKPEAHPPAEEIAAGENRSMIEIGG